MSEQIEAILIEQGFEHYGWTTLQTPLSLSLYKSWINDGFHGDMEYLKNHLAAKEEPARILPRAQSAIVIARSYFPHPKQKKTLRLPVALYAQGEDYHDWFRAELESVADKLFRVFPSEQFLAATDSSPVLERDLAYRAGLGWIGKNTCLINENRGSLFFIGEILTSLTLTAQMDVAADRCGSCTKCIDACPTQAIVEPRKLDARKCISYLTIESKSPPEENLRDLNRHFYYGCDICQTVCPWNLKVHGKETLSPPEVSQAELLEDLRFVLRSSGKQLIKHFAGTPLTRASNRHHKSNAMVLAANLGLRELRDDIRDTLALHSELQEIGEWALNKLAD